MSIVDQLPAALFRLRQHGDKLLRRSRRGALTSLQPSLEVKDRPLRHEAVGLGCPPVGVCGSLGLLEAPVLSGPAGRKIGGHLRLQSCEGGVAVVPELPAVLAMLRLPSGSGLQAGIL